MFGKASRSKAERESETALLRADAVDKSKARALRLRSAYYLNHQLDLGDEAIRFREAFFERHGSTQGWLKPFVARQFDLGEAMSRASRAAYNQVKCAVRTVQGDRKEAGGKGQKATMLAFESRKGLQAAPARRWEDAEVPCDCRGAVELVRGSHQQSASADRNTADHRAGQYHLHRPVRGLAGA